MEDTHKQALKSVQDIIQSEVIQKQVIIRFYVLLDVYRDKLKGTQFENDKYRPDKLMNKIQKDRSFPKVFHFVSQQKDLDSLRCAWCIAKE